MLLNVYDGNLDITKFLDSKIIDNILYICYYNGKKYLKLLKFDMSKRYIVSDDYISTGFTKDYIPYVYINNNNLIVFIVDYQYDYDYLVNIYNLSNLKLDDNLHFGIDKIIPRQKTLIKINVTIDNEIYYVTREKDVDNCFVIVNRKGNILLNINYDENNNNVNLNNDVLYLPKYGAYTIRYNNGFLLIYFRYSNDYYYDPYTCVIYNLYEKTISTSTCDIINFTSEHHIIYSENELDVSNLYIGDLTSNYKYLLPKHLEKYGDIDIVHYKDIKYLLNIKDNCFNIHMIYEPQLQHISECNNDKHITIGTKDENVVLPLELLFKRSALIKGLFSDISNVPDILLYDSYVNMKIYKEFVVNGRVESENLYKLYHICNYLNDTEINYVSELILLFIKDNYVRIRKSFRFLELLSTSLCDNQLNALLYIIMRKYDRGDIYNNIMEYKDTKLYDFALKQLFTTAYDSISKYN